MRRQLISQHYNSLKALNDNVQTIKQLIKQAENLESLVSQLPANIEFKKLLEEEVYSTGHIIETLIIETERLFESYNSFAEKAFKFTK